MLLNGGEYMAARKLSQPSASSREYLRLRDAKHKQLRAELRAERKAKREAKRAGKAA
jgi:hypothetical protein